MTPAEKLAKKKQWRRAKRNGPPSPPRRAVWKPRLRELRESLRISMRDVAAAVGLGLSSYWQIENGTDPMLTNAVRIATFFGRAVEDLWPTANRRTPP